MKKNVKRKESILSIREKKLAYSLVLPTMILVLSIVIIPLLANFWISFKPISLGDLRPPKLILKENLRSEPNFEDYETCTQVPYKEGFSPKLDKNLEKKYCSDSIWWENPKEENQATLKLYMGWKDGGPVNLFGLILFLDATTPPIYNKLGTVGWVPTLTLTSHIRNIPEPGPLKVIAKTEFITNNYIEEDREIWDSKGNLVGQSKQLAKLRIKK